jgi:hypothetical protein
VPAVPCADCRESRESIGPDALYVRGPWNRKRLLCEPCVRSSRPPYPLDWPPRRFRVCRRCGRRRYYQSGWPRDFCTDICKRQHERGLLEQRRQRWRERVRPSRPYMRCGQPFTAGRSDARYCSSACRQRAYRQRSRWRRS